MASEERKKWNRVAARRCMATEWNKKKLMQRKMPFMFR
jgi:hypothetical protein